MFGRLFPGSIQILDFYHACDHLVHVAEAMYGKDIESGRQWQKAHQADLNANAVGGVVAAIDAWEPATAAQRDIRVSKATVSPTMTSVCGINVSRSRLPYWQWRGGSRLQTRGGTAFGPGRNALTPTDSRSDRHVTSGPAFYPANRT